MATMLRLRGTELPILTPFMSLRVLGVIESMPGKGSGLRVGLLVPTENRGGVASGGDGMQPETRYAWLGQDRIAYQLLGKGPPDLVMTGCVTVDVAWEDPAVALFLRSRSPLCPGGRIIVPCGGGASSRGSQTGHSSPGAV